MARDEARIFAAIWKDEDFRNLPRSAQGLYFFLLSQPDLSYCGLIPLRVGKWARAAAGLTTGDVLADLKHLAESSPRPFVVVDEETEEVFVRSLIRNDRIWKQPNLMKAAREAAKLVESPAIRRALAEELKRIPIESSESRFARKVLAEFLEDLGERPEFPTDIPPGTPSDDPSRKGSGKGSGNPSDEASGDSSADPSQGKGVRGRGKDSPPVDPEGLFSGSGGQAADPEPDPDAEEPDEDELGPREDVERLCVHLADRIEANGSKRPRITKTWRNAARLLIDLDGRTERQVHNMIDWCQADEWWRSRVMSMPKLRDKYDALRLQALPGSGQRTGNRGQPGRSTTDERVSQAADLARRLAERDGIPHLREVSA